MATEPINPSGVIEQSQITPIERGANSQSVDGLSSNSIQSGVVKRTRGKGKQKQEPETRGPGPSPSGSGTGETQNNEVNRVVQQPVASGGNPFKDSDNILQAIADRFVDARKHQKAAAWRQLQVDLMHASPFICPVIIPYKDLISIVSDIEKEIKGATEQVGKSNEEIMASFLSGEGSLVVAEMNIAPDMTHGKSIDSRDIIKSDGGEDGPVKDIPLSVDPSIPPISPPSS